MCIFYFPFKFYYITLQFNLLILGFLKEEQMLKMIYPPNIFYLDLEKEESQRHFMIKFILVVSQLIFLGDKLKPL